MYSLGSIYSILVFLCVGSLYVGNKLHTKGETQIGSLMMLLGVMQLGAMLIAIF